MPMGIAMGFSSGPGGGGLIPQPTPEQQQQGPLPEKLAGFFSGLRPRTADDKKASRIGSDRDKKLSASGIEFLSYLEDYSMAPPKEVNLKARWGRLFDEQRGRAAFQTNKKAILSELRRLDLSCSDDVLVLLEDFLSGPLFTREETRRVVLTALKLQAGQQSVGGDIDSREGMPNIVVSKLAAWSLEIALAEAVKKAKSGASAGGASSLFGQSAVATQRSREDLLAIVTDKQERALVSNIIFPQVMPLRSRYVYRSLTSYFIAMIGHWRFV